MPRRLAIFMLLPGILGILLFMATPSERRGAASAAIAQNDEQVTLLAVENAGSHPQLYAIDPETGAIGLLVDNLPLAPVALEALDSDRVLIAVNPRSLADPSRVLLADLVSHAWHTLFTDLQGAFGLAIRPDRSAVLTAQGRADWPMPITEYDFQTGETRTLASIPSPYQPLDLAFTPPGRLFLSAGHNWACVLMELDPVTGAILNQWPGPCEPTNWGGSMYSVAYDPRTDDLVGAVYVRTLDEVRIWRFRPATDTAPHVWMTLPGTQGRFDRIAVAPDGTLYAAAYMGEQFPGRDWGILKIAPDQTVSVVLPPGRADVPGEHGAWGPLGVLVGPRPETLGPVVTYTPTPPPTATPHITNTPTPTATPRPGQVDIDVTPEPLQIGYFTLSLIHI